jgi:preprotein translocase subunit SecG
MPSEVKWAISFLAGGFLIFIGWKVYVVLVTLHVLICLVLIAVILLQSGEAADLAGAFGGSGSQTAFGPRGAATFLSRATTWCAVMFMFTSMVLTVHIDTTTAGSGHSVLEQFSKPSSTKPAVPGQGGAPLPVQPIQPALPSAPPAQPAPAPAPAAP